MIAKEKGLEPLANLIWLQQIKEPAEELARAYVSEENRFPRQRRPLQGQGIILQSGFRSGRLPQLYPEDYHGSGNDSLVCKGWGSPVCI